MLIAYVIQLFLYLYSRQAFLTEVVLFYEQPPNQRKCRFCVSQ
jgi:hypothetical protein